MWNWNECRDIEKRGGAYTYIVSREVRFEFVLGLGLFPVPPRFFGVLALLLLLLGIITLKSR